MKAITPKIPCIFPYALVLTTNHISISGNLYAADFRDNKSLYSRKIKSYIGFRPDIRVTTIKPGFILKNGFWYGELSEVECSLPLMELDLIVKEWEWLDQE